MALDTDLEEFGDRKRADKEKHCSCLVKYSLIEVGSGGNSYPGSPLPMQRCILGSVLNLVVKCSLLRVAVAQTESRA